MFFFTWTPPFIVDVHMKNHPLSSRIPICSFLFCWAKKKAKVIRWVGGFPFCWPKNTTVPTRLAWLRFAQILLLLGVYHWAGTTQSERTGPVGKYLKRIEVKWYDTCYILLSYIYIHVIYIYTCYLYIYTSTLLYMIIYIYTLHVGCGHVPWLADKMATSHFQTKLHSQITCFSSSRPQLRIYPA